MLPVVPVQDRDTLVSVLDDTVKLALLGGRVSVNYETSAESTEERPDAVVFATTLK
jgi:hypothetical protein